MELTFCLGEYDVFSRIGKGGMGEVWKAVHRRTGTDAAIKMMTAEDASEPGPRAAFHAEVRAAAALDHPHIVRLFDYGTILQQLPVDEMGELIGSPYRHGVGGRRKLNPMEVQAAF